MRALSIRQPWAWLIVNGHKDVENRSWSTELRGQVLIHAGKEIDKQAHLDLMRGIHPVTGRPTKLSLMYPPALGRDVETGGIVGVAEIHGCVTRSDSEWFAGPYGFLMRHRRALPFQRCAGQLGFFTPAVTVDIRGEASGEGQESLL